MAGHFQLFASNGDNWQSVKNFSSPDDLATARMEADRLVESGQFQNAMVVERMAGDLKAKPKPVYRKSFKSPKKRETESLELVVQKGLTGEWIVIPEKYAKRYKYYGANGLVAWLAFILVAGPIFELIAAFGGYHPDISLEGITDVGILLATFAVAAGLSWWLGWAFWKEKRKAAFYGITYFVILGILSLLALDFIGIGKSALITSYLLLSLRVNATYRHRIRRRDLEYTIPLKKLENAKFISATSPRKKKRK